MHGQDMQTSSWGTRFGIGPQPHLRGESRGNEQKTPEKSVEKLAGSPQGARLQLLIVLQSCSELLFTTLEL
jgi:hypothetical protein